MLNAKYQGGTVNLNVLVSISSVLQGIVAIFSLATVVLTIVLVVRQTREMTRQSIYSAYGTAGNIYKDVSIQMMEIDRLFFEHPEIRPYFYDNQPPPDDPHEAARIEALAELFMDFLDMVIVLETTTPPELNIPWAEWQDYIADLYLSSPAIRHFYRTNRDWYDTKVRELLDPLDEQLAADGWRG